MNEANGLRRARLHSAAGSARTSVDLNAPEQRLASNALKTVEQPG